MVPDGFPAPISTNIEIAFLFSHCISAELSSFFNLHCPWLLELTSKPKEPPQDNGHMLQPSESPFCFFLEQECCQDQGGITTLF